MTDDAEKLKPRTMPPLRLDPSATSKRSLEGSSSRSSVCSSWTHTPSSSVPNTPIIPARPPSPEKKQLHPEDSNAFLTALAAQERRVLELKEELQKEEVKLQNLKKQWASHEASKKKNELRHLEQLKPLRASLSEPKSVTPRSADSSITERHPDGRTMAPPMAKPSRTVFSGSRHTRTLSLLSPKDPAATGSHETPHSSRPLKLNRSSTKDDAIAKTTREPRIATDGPNDPDELYRGPPKDMILETGKQLVGDFRHGLWTFLEDLRQVTVGDEAASTADLRSQHSMLGANTPKTHSRKEKILLGKSSFASKVDDLSSSLAECQPEGFVGFKQRNNVASQTSNSADMGSSTKLADGTHISNKNSIFNESNDDDEDDGWDHWDTAATKSSTPTSKKSTSATNLLSSPLTDKSSPRTSISSVDATPRPEKVVRAVETQDDMSWPALTGLSPRNLTSTASILMSEWEKSLASPGV